MIGRNLSFAQLLCAISVISAAVLLPVSFGYNSYLLFALSCFLFFASIFFFFDSVARHRDASLDNISDVIYGANQVHRIWFYVRKSRCGRSAAIVEARKRGLGTACALYYQDLGYRWWHIFPDGAPQVFFSWRWWRGVFL